MDILAVAPFSLLHVVVLVFVLGAVNRLRLALALF